MSQMYAQCLLQKGNEYCYSWIPAELARVGKTIRVKATGEIWTVKERWSVRSEEQISTMDLPQRADKVLGRRR